MGRISTYSQVEYTHFRGNASTERIHVLVKENTLKGQITHIFVANTPTVRIHVFFEGIYTYFLVNTPGGIIHKFLEGNTKQ